MDSHAFMANADSQKPTIDCNREKDNQRTLPILNNFII